MSCRWRSPRCYSPSLNPVRSCRSWSQRINVRPAPLRRPLSRGAPLGESGKGLQRMGAEEDPGETVLFPALSPGCLLTIILLMRALDPLQYEKETLQYFQTLKASRVRGNRRGGGPAGRRRAADVHSPSLLPARPWTLCGQRTWTTCEASSCWRTACSRWSTRRCACCTLVTR